MLFLSCLLHTIYIPVRQSEVFHFIQPTSMKIFMPEEEMRNLEQAKVLLDYFLENNFSEAMLAVGARENNIYGSRPSVSAAHTALPPLSNPPRTAKS